jgi:hypothetical protein
MSRNTASRRKRIGEVLFVTVKQPRRSLKRTFFVPTMAVVLSGSTVWPGAAGEPDPGDLVSMLDRGAIVEAMPWRVRNPDRILRRRLGKHDNVGGSATRISTRLSSLWSER